MDLPLREAHDYGLAAEKERIERESMNERNLRNEQRNKARAQENARV